MAISTHAPRTGSDRYSRHKAGGNSYFNPRSPHGERRFLPPRGRLVHPDFNPRSPHGERRESYETKHETQKFQPTLPARGATKSRQSKCDRRQHFNPRSPHGERPSVCLSVRSVNFDFNPRSPHGERR